MYKFWSVKQGHLKFRHCLAVAGLVLMSVSLDQVRELPSPGLRAPASYVPDDDVIVKPEDNQISLYQQYISSDQSADVVNARNQIKIWNDNQVFADQYGLQTDLAGSPYFVPTPDEKWEYFKGRYLRYLKGRGETPIKNMPQNWYQEYRASNEVDTIDEMEARFKRSHQAASDKGETKSNLLPPSMRPKEVSLWKKTKFIFQPRVDQGIVIVGFKMPVAYARAWVGVNGQTEINVQQTYDSIGLRAMFNYYAHTGEYFTSLDQRIMENISARYTRSNNPNTKVQDDTIMLLYGKSF
jgi:hypothetical protein